MTTYLRKHRDDFVMQSLVSVRETATAVCGDDSRPWISSHAEYDRVRQIVFSAGFSDLTSYQLSADEVTELMWPLMETHAFFRLCLLLGVPQSLVGGDYDGLDYVEGLQQIEDGAALRQFLNSDPSDHAYRLRLVFYVLLTNQCILYRLHRNAEFIQQLFAGAEQDWEDSLLSLLKAVSGNLDIDNTEHHDNLRRVASLYDRLRQMNGFVEFNAEHLVRENRRSSPVWI